jgi:guanylate cyclase
MRDEIVDLARRDGHPWLAVRIGIDAGPAVAGVIGRRKFIYDLWGDTVNTASRMESQGLPGQVQVTERVAEVLQGSFALRPRGLVDVKGKGLMRTFLLTAPRPQPEAVLEAAEAGPPPGSSSAAGPPPGSSSAAGPEDLRP